MRGEKGIWVFFFFFWSLPSFAARIELAAGLLAGKEKHRCRGRSESQ